MARTVAVYLCRLRDDGTPGRVVALKSPDLPMPGRGGALQKGQRGVRDIFRDSFRDIALSPDGNRLFLASFEEISGWAIRGEKLERLWTIPGKNPCMALSPDGRTLAIGDRVGTLLLVDPASGQLRKRLDLPGSDTAASIGSLAFSPDGSELAVGSRQQVRLWAVGGDAPPRPLVRLPGHRGLVTLLAYDSHGGLLATGGDDNAVKVWDLARVRSELTLLGLDCKRH
jgi:WD40 repeat protein